MRKDKTINLGYWLSASANEPIQVDLIVALGSGERDQMAAVLYNAGYAKKILLTGMGVGSIAGQSHYQARCFIGCISLAKCLGGQ